MTLCYRAHTYARSANKAGCSRQRLGENKDGCVMVQFYLMLCVGVAQVDKEIVTVERFLYIRSGKDVPPSVRVRYRSLRPSETTRITQE